MRWKAMAVAALLVGCGMATDPEGGDDEAQLAQEQTAALSTGLDVLAARFASGTKAAGQIPLPGKRIALVVNHTAVTTANRTHAIDVFRSAGLDVVKVFAPEHGVRGEAEAGEAVASTTDPKTGIPIVSLYGSKKKPSAADLADVDVLFFDMQDVGARFYTYVSTLGLVMEAAAEQGKPVLVLDRPNPIGPRADGNVLEAPTGFVAMWKIPVQHGMTVGELSTMIRGEGWIAKASSLRLDVVKAKGYSRAVAPSPQLLPNRPSPNLRSHNAALLYPGTCLLEASNVSEGRGTDKPFETMGAPWITGDLQVLARTLRENAAPMVPAGSVTITPWEGTPTASKHAGRRIRGLRFVVNDAARFRPVPFGVAILTTLNQLYRADLQWREPSASWLRELWGDHSLRDAVQAPAAALPRAAEALANQWKPEVEAFERLRDTHNPPYRFPEYQ